MSAIDELLAMTDEDEAWEVIPRYEVNAMYADDDGPVEVNNKSIGDMSSQISIQGESLSQYVEFVMPRYYDNIDLSEKVLSIHYRLGERVGDNAPVNVYKSQDRIKFGWLIPANATADEGKLAISIWARSLTDTEEYIWKSRTTHYTIERGMTIGEGITEPDENWYLDFVRQMDTKVSEALLYATRAKQSESSAFFSELNARTYMETASTGASTAVQKAGEALDSASTASASSVTAQESATLAMEYRDGAEEYYERTKGIAEGLSGQLVPMGTVTFENLPALEDAVAGWMYNISNEFTTTSQFKEGAGKVIPLGSNIFKTTDGYWDVLAGSPVSGIKGSAETIYRSGNVNITPANLGITVVNNTKDENKNVKHAATATSAESAVKDSEGNVINAFYSSKEESSISSSIVKTKEENVATTTDSTDAPIICLKENGYTEQFTTSGKNLCSSNNFTVTAPASGTPQSNYAYKSINIHNKITSNKTYIFSADIKKLVGSPSEISIVFMNEALSTGTEIKTGTITNNHVEISISIGNASVYYYLLVYAGKQGSTAGNSIEFSNVMLRESTTDSTYEPYTGGVASPNPDYPQEIKCIDKISVKTCGKNLFKNTATTQTNKGITFTINNDGSVTANGTATDLAQLWLENNSLNDRLEVGKTYIATGFSNVGVVADGKTTYTTEFVFTEKTERIAPYIQLASGATVNDKIFYPMIRLASIEDDAYQPYTETLAEIDLTEPLYEGDYIEYRADGTGVLHRKMASVVFDGSSDEEWNKGLLYYIGIPDAKYANSDANTANVKGCCSHFKFVGSYNVAQSSGYGNCGFGVIVSKMQSMIGLNSDVTTISELKTWLQSNPVTVVYELATPQEIELTAEQLAQFKQLRTFEPITNIFCDGETVTQYYKNNGNGECVGGLQDRVENIENTRAVRVNGNAKQIYGDGVEGSMEVSRFQLDEKTYLVDIKVTLTKIPETLSGNGPSIDLSLSDLGFDSEASAYESMCILSSYYPIITNGGNYCLGGGMCSTDNFGRGFYFRFLPHKNTKGSISSVNTSVLAGCMMIRLQ